MNKILYILFIVLICNYVSGQDKNVIVNGQELKFVQTTFNDTLQAEFIDIYSKDKKVMRHTIYHIDGDCSSTNIELGAYEVIDNKIVVYSYWASGDRMMKNIYPFGFKKRIFRVANNGSISELSSVIYIESYVDSYDEHQGMEFLNKTPQTEADSNLLKDYVSKAEKMYAGKFVFRNDKDLLEQEVRKKLKSEIEDHTSSWKEVYGNNCKM